LHRRIPPHSSNAILAPMAEYPTSRVWSPFTQMKAAVPTLNVRSGSGAVLELQDGRRLLDCISSWWVTLHGHAQPEIAAAIAAQAQQLEQVLAAGFTHRPAEELARRLVDSLPAAMVLEPLVQGAGGMRMCRPQFLVALQALLREHDVLMIYDEVLTGFGRTGELFACEKTATQPDIICLAKGLTGGFLPLAATVCNGRVFDAFYHDDPSKAFYHGHSYTANPLGCAAALASLDLLVVEKYRSLADWQREQVVRLHQHERLCRVRSCGTIVAVDVLVDGDEGYLHQVGTLLRERFLARGFLLRPLGNTVYILPPYCIDRAQLSSVYDVLFELLDEL
jgi:adenosylmethionine-8-amino-7-oxononanoate aminotransferase